MYQSDDRVKILNRNIEQVDKETIIEEIPDAPTSRPEKEESNIRKLSPFHKLFFFETSIQSKTVTNECYELTAMEVLRDEYMPLFPLWSGKLLDEGVSRDSNVPVECWFRISKHDILRLPQLVSKMLDVLNG